MPPMQFGHTASPYQHRIKIVSTASGHALLEMLAFPSLQFGFSFPAKIYWSRVGAGYILAVVSYFTSQYLKDQV